MYKILKVTAYILGKLLNEESTKKMIEKAIRRDPVAFAVHYVTEEQLQEIYDNLEEPFSKNPNLEKMDAFSIHTYNHPIVGYYHGYKEIKISDPTSQISGHFAIKKGQIIYNPSGTKFNEERDAFVYFYASDEYYTTEPIESIIKDYLFDGRKCFLDSNSYSTKPPYERLKDAISPDELYNRIIEKLNVKEEDDKGDKVKKLKNKNNIN